MNILKWFLRKTYRDGVEQKRHILRLLDAQRDILSKKAIDNILLAASELEEVLKAPFDKKAIAEKIEKLEQVANANLIPYPHQSWRENVEVFLVAIAVAMGIRTFFLQPFKIPTGSMQPTLYGITHINLKNRPDIVFPTGLKSFVNSWFYGISYYRVVAKNDGELNNISPVRKFVFFNILQTFRIGDETYYVWFPPDQLFDGIARAGVYEGQAFKKGEDVIKLVVKSGDHLFVDRMTFNFRHPKRGEIIVFETRGIQGIPQDQFYIKRLIALGGEKVRIGNDQHVYINGQRLDASTPRFENVYTFGDQPVEGGYFGHVNNFVAAKYHKAGLAPLFPDGDAEFTVSPKHYLVLGDNTLNSLDSRYWGDFPQENVIGKAFFVYWPISPRFGWEHR
ncbi:MAG: signal peptidase I [Limisphaerales bacterium]|jgi:signal peptidase I